MWDFDLGEAFDAMRKTAPFILFRMVVYLGIGLLYVVGTGVGGALGYGFTAFGDGEGAGAGYGALFGFAGAAGLAYWLREYILYVVKAGHIAVLVQLMDGKVLPEGRGQLEHASAVVKERFGQASLLFALDQLLKGILRVVSGTLNSVAAFLPIPGIQSLAGFINGVLRVALGFVDEVILAQIIREESTNPWQTGSRSLVLYAQNFATMAKNAVWLALFMWLLTFLIFVLILGPVLALMATFPGSVGAFGFVAAFMLAWSFKAALLEPLAIYALMTVFFRTTEGQEPDAAWEQRLQAASDKFGELKQKALDVTGGSAA